MDTLYIGDISSDYHYADFGNGYITLYNQPTARNEILNYYRIWTNCDGFYYEVGSTTFGSYQTQYFQDVSVSSYWLYRTDIDKIFLVSFIIVLMFLFVFNIVTSVFKKGGVFSGLL